MSLQINKFHKRLLSEIQADGNKLYFWITETQAKANRIRQLLDHGYISSISKMFPCIELNLTEKGKNAICYF